MTELPALAGQLRTLSPTRPQEKHAADDQQFLWWLCSMLWWLCSMKNSVARTVAVLIGVLCVLTLFTTACTVPDERSSVGVVQAVPVPTPERPVDPSPGPADPQRDNHMVDLRQFGGRCDGTTDDRQAFEQALGGLDAAGGGTLTVPVGDCVVVQTAQKIFLSIGSRIRIRGVAGTDGAVSRILLSSNNNTEYRELFRISGDHVRLENLQLVRVSHSTGVLLKLYPLTDLALTGVTLDGNVTEESREMHGIELARTTNGQFSDIRIASSTFRHLEYGLFQVNEAVNQVTNVVVTGSVFVENHSDDLEFNAPNGSMENVTVERSHFLRNLSERPTAGFGVGFANVRLAAITGNTFTDYGYEPIHIEDFSTGITISDNRFVRAYTNASDWASHIFIISGSSDIRITGNEFDTTGNRSPMQCVYVGAGGAARPAPAEIVLIDNTFRLNRWATAVAVYDDATVTDGGNATVRVP